MAGNTPQDLSTIIQAYEDRITHLEDALRSIFNNNNAATNTATPSQAQASSIKPNKPQAFTGDKKGPKADTWCFQLQVFFEAAQEPPEKQVPTAVTFLRESAELWWMEHVRKTTDEHMHPTSERISSFGVFVQAIKSHFMTTTRVEDARERLPSLKQSGWVRGYVNAFQKLVMQIPDMTDGEKFWRFKEGLNAALRKEVTKEDCKTYEDAVRLVLRLDAVDTKFGNKSFSNATFASKPSPTTTPMEIDAIRVGAPPTSMPKLSKEELKKKFGGKLTPDMKDEMRKLGVCFYCREQAGHVAQSCPKKAKALN